MKQKNLSLSIESDMITLFVCYHYHVAIICYDYCWWQNKKTKIYQTLKYRYDEIGILSILNAILFSPSFSILFRCT